MKYFLHSSLLVSCLLLAFFTSHSGDNQPSSPKSRPLIDRVFERTSVRQERGKYLSEGVLQCLVCHSERDWTLPGAPPIASRKGAGQIWYNDSSYFLAAPNITPDSATGAGTWTDDMLARAIREGVGHDGRALHPQMWYGSFRSLSDEDLASVIVYLRSLPPVHNVLSPRRLPETRLLEIAEMPEPLTEPVPEPNTSDAVQRGKYFADIADCIGCHTAWEAPYSPGAFGGGNLIERTGAGYDKRAFSSNLTPDPSGISYYDDSLFIEVMSTGRVRAREISPVMPWIAFQHMNSNDLRAIFTYLKTLPPVRHIIDNSQEASFCAMCGQEHGEGRYNVSKLDLIDALPVSAIHLSPLAGRYENPEFTIEIRVVGDTLKGNASGVEMKFVMDKDSLFYAREWPGSVSFIRDSVGHVTHFISHEENLFIAVRK